jgi:hypothetical protein
VVSSLGSYPGGRWFESIPRNQLGLIVRGMKRVLRGVCKIPAIASRVVRVHFRGPPPTTPIVAYVNVGVMMRRSGELKFVRGVVKLGHRMRVIDARGEVFITKEGHFLTLRQHFVMGLATDAFSWPPR